MATKGKIEAGAEFDVSAWNKGINDLISSAGQAEKAVDSLIKTLNNVKIGGATGAFVIQVDDTQIKDAIALRGELSVNTDFMAGVNTSELSTAQTAHDELFENTEFVASVQEMDIEDAIALRNDLNESTSFNVQVGKGEIEAAQRAHDDLYQNTSFTANVNDAEIEAAKNKRDDLDNNTSFTANVNTEEIDGAVRKKTDLESGTEVKVNVDDTEVKNLVEQIRNMQAVDIGFTVGGAALGAGKSVFDFAAGGILEMDTALLKLQGTTNESIPGARELIEELYTNAWGESRTQIAEVLALGTQLGISQDEMADALLSAFETASVTGEDVTQVLRAQDQFVKQGLTPTYRDAADVIIDGFTQGGGRADDLFDTIIEYSSTFKGLGLSAQEATQLVVNGMDAGAMNTDLAADALREFGIRARDLGAQATVDVYKELNLEDTVQGFRDGTVSGKELLEQVFARMEGLDPSEKARMGLELFGTQSEDLGMHVIDALNPATLELQAIAGAASNAATLVNSDLQTSFTELKRTVENELANAIDNTFDISGLIDRAKEAVITFADEIQAGESIFGAAEIALALPGLEDTMQELQQIFANVGIAIMQAMSDVLDTLGKDAAADSIDALVADMAGVQLDIEIGTSENFFELQDNVNRAMSRGLSQGELLPKLIDEFNVAIENGNFGLANAIMHEIDALEVDGIVQEIFDTNADDVTDIADSMAIAAQLAMGEAANKIDPSQVEQFADALLATETLYDTLHSNLSVAVDEAIANSDLERLLDLSQVLGADGSRAGAAAQQLQGFYEQAVTEAISSLDLTAARENLDLLGDQAPQALKDQADQLAIFLEEEVQNALDRHEPQLALDYAKLLGNEELIQQVQVMVDAIHPIETAFSDTMNAAQGSATQNMDQITLDMGDLSTSISTGVSTIKEDMKGFEEAGRVMAEESAKTFDKLGTDAETGFDNVQTSAGDTSSKLDTDSDTMEQSITGFAGELLLQSLAMGLSFLAISGASQAMQEGVSESMDIATEDYLLFADTITNEGDGIIGAFEGIEEYAVTWADVIVEEFQFLSEEFNIMVNSVQTNGGRLIDTLTQLSNDIQDIDLSVEVDVPATTGKSSSSGNSSSGGGSTSRRISTATITATPDEIAGKDGYYAPDPSGMKVYFHEKGNYGYWSAELRDNKVFGLFTYRPPKVEPGGGISNSQVNSDVDYIEGVTKDEFYYSDGTDTGTTIDLTKNPTRGTGTTRGSGAVGDSGEIRAAGRELKSAMNEVEGSFESFNRHLVASTEIVTSWGATLQEQIAIALGVSTPANTSQSSISNTNSISITSNNPAVASNALTSANQLRGF